MTGPRDLRQRAIDPPSTNPPLSGVNDDDKNPGFFLAAGAG
jgi:hypothetical protein